MTETPIFEKPEILRRMSLSSPIILRGNIVSLLFRNQELFHQLKEYIQTKTTLTAYDVATHFHLPAALKNGLTTG